MKKVIFPSLLMMMAAFFVSGCQDRGATNQSMDKGSPNRSQFYSTRDNPRHTRSNDMNNLNPNFLNLQGTRNGELAGNSQSHGKDIDKAKQVINNTGEFRVESVWISSGGDRMRVTAFKKGKLSRADKNAAEARLHRKLIHALPRYMIDVTVLQDKR